MIFIVLFALLVYIFIVYNAPYILVIIIILFAIGIFTSDTKNDSPHRGERIQAPKN